MDATTLVDLADQPYRCLRTTGRRSGRPHTFRNLQTQPSACVRLGDHELQVGAPASLTDPAARARAVAALHAKYGGQVSGTEQNWQRDAFIVALDPQKSAS